MMKFDENLKGYLKEIAKHKILTREEEIDLFIRYKNGDISARELIINSNLRFVIKVALSYAGRGLSVADLIQEGNLGLLEVIDKYDVTKGFRFSTYAAFWIRQSIQIALRRNNSFIKIPNCKARLLGKISEAISVFINENGREPNISEIATSMGITTTKAESALRLRENVVSLDAEYNDESMPLIQSVYNKDEVTAREKCIKKQTSEKVSNVLDFLNDREKKIVKLRFGFTNGKSMSLRKTSKVIGLSQEGIRRIEIRAINKLKRQSISAKIVGLI